MSTEQDWTSVWPAAQSFKWSVVPFPVRQGFAQVTTGGVSKHQLSKQHDSWYDGKPSIIISISILYKNCKDIRHIA